MRPEPGWLEPQLIDPPAITDLEVELREDLEPTAIDVTIALGSGGIATIQCRDVVDMDRVWTDTEARMRRITDRLSDRLPPEGLAWIREFLDHAEYGVAFEELIPFLREQHATLAEDEVIELRALARVMGIEFDVAQLGPSPDRSSEGADPGSADDARLAGKTEALREVLRRIDPRSRGWVLVDHWEADAAAIGLARREVPRRLAHLTTWATRPGRVTLTLETPTGSDWTDFEQREFATDMSVEAAIRVISRHLDEPLRKARETQAGSIQHGLVDDDGVRRITPGPWQIDRIQFSYQARLSLAGAAGELHVDLGCPGRITDRSGASEAFEPERPETLYHVIALLRRSVTEVRIEQDGTLELVLEDGGRLSVPSDPDHEAWTMVSLPLLVVCTPGGEIAAWW